MLLSCVGTFSFPPWRLSETPSPVFTIQVGILSLCVREREDAVTDTTVGVAHAQSQSSPSVDMVRRIDAGPVKIAALTLEQTLPLIDTMIASTQRHSVCFCEVNLLAQAQYQEHVANVLNAASLTFPDGGCVLKLAQASGNPLPERVPGPLLFLRACEYGVSRGWKHYFYGGAEGVAETLATRMEQRFPGIRIVGVHSPPYRPVHNLAEDNRVLKKIDESGADLLWVALGGPKQEIWLAEHRHRLKVPVMLAVGAAFDFHSGNRSWAPPIIRKVGAEWVWRMFTGGPAMFKRNAKGVTIVSTMIVHAWLRRIFCRRAR